jgi:hypothetical protein
MDNLVSDALDFAFRTTSGMALPKSKDLVEHFISHGLEFVLGLRDTGAEDRLQW